MILREDLDAVVASIDLEVGGLEGEGVLAAQFVLNLDKGVGDSGQLEGEKCSSAGSIRDTLQHLDILVTRSGDIGADGVHDHLGTLRHFDGFLAGYVALVSSPSLNRMMARRTGPLWVACVFISLSRQA